MLLLFTEWGYKLLIGKSQGGVPYQAFFQWGEYFFCLGGGDRPGACCNGSRGIWDWRCFSCGVAHHGGNLISAFQGFSASIGKIFVLAGGLGAGLLLFHGV